MKTYKLIFMHFLFFVFIYLATHLLKEQIFIKRACIVILILGLTYVIYNYLSKIKYLCKGFIVNLFSLFVLFEIMKATEYLLNLMPKYSEGIVVSMTGSFIGIAIYLGFIVLMYSFTKVLSKKKVDS